MGRELRRVPKDWEHPQDSTGRYTPLMQNYGVALEQFVVDIEEKGLGEALDYWGGGPQTDKYMPDWTWDEAPYFMMYEDTSEGTPISPAFETIEELAHWLADTGASAFGRLGASYEAWLLTCQHGYAISALGVPGKGIISGVEAMYDIEQNQS